MTTTRPSQRECSSTSGLTHDEVAKKFDELIQLTNARHASGTCILANEGCPPAIVIPSCATEFLECARFLTPDEFEWKARDLEGKKVAVRGNLRRVHVLSTVLGCSEGYCCNQAAGTLGFDDDMRKGLLLDANNPSMFRCIGDDSTTCCPVELPTEDVVATGIVERYSSIYGIGEVALCRVSTNR